MFKRYDTNNNESIDMKEMDKLILVINIYIYFNVIIKDITYEFCLDSSLRLEIKNSYIKFD